MITDEAFPKIIKKQFDGTDLLPNKEMQKQSTLEDARKGDGVPQDYKEAVHGIDLLRR